MSSPRKPRPNAPRGKVRVAGSGPAGAKSSTTSNAPADDTSSTTVSMEKKSTSPKTAGERASSSSPVPTSSRSGFLTWGKVLIVAAVAVVIGVFAVVAAFKPGVSDTESNLAFTNASATSELKSQAGDRICAVLSVNPEKFDDWANNAKTGLTGEALAEFNQYQTTTRDLAAQSGQGAECQVDLVAVSHMDDSTATVIATLIISNTQQGVAVMGGPGQARTELGLQKVDGQWKISRISDF